MEKQVIDVSISPMILLILIGIMAMIFLALFHKQISKVSPKIFYALLILIFGFFAFVLLYMLHLISIFF